MSQWDIPELLPDRLATVVPECTYAGGEISDASKILCIWRTCKFPAEARGGVPSLLC